ncbi:ankyrin repeat protein [Monoraphidium neglectum]|uniref:Ankyrin repeat protein n=1 Tax=Monoraphidium neglectum TaxID=145388 RepID=A0A0D2N0D5_9CHLO|nr:ankyrin repeat protein [Monoraphidium neglectum]KIZ06017.1 ankyrin repeat protein [Monoraphidium neglectum]|eukprot:XP_013905036.1 ankyrin repeat protein [Monoraphidium neglectum]
MPFDLLTGVFIPEKSNIWRDCCDGMYDWVKEHVMEGCTLNEADLCGDPPLVLAAGNGHLAVVKYLLSQGAGVEQRSVMQETALIRAAHNGHLNVVEHLLSAGAAIDARDLGDNSALHWAAMRGHVEVVRALVAAGADKTARNKQGCTPIDLCEPQWSLSWRFAREVLAA